MALLVKYLAYFLAFLLIKAQIPPKSRCPNYGTYNLKCTSHDYCNKSVGLVCGDGYCGLECPVGWVNFNNSCYYLAPSQTTIMSAIDTCKNKNAKLLQSVKSKNDINDLYSAISQLDNSTHIWLSAFKTHDYEFKYSDGTQLLANDSLWNAPNEPYDNTYKDENCVTISKMGAYDVECGTFIASFICELEKTCTRSQCNCGSDSYFDDSLKQCVSYATLNENCVNNCNANQGLYCMNGKCVCPVGTTWDNVAQMCIKCCHTVFACDYNTLSINCSPYRISIVNAFYGSADSRCAAVSPTKCVNPNAFSVVQSLCNETLSCSFTNFHVIFFGDPCGGIAKYAYVAYICY